MSDALRVEAVGEGRDALLVLTGDLTYATVPLFLRALEEVLDPFHPQLLLDVGRLHFCDSIGLSALLGAQRRARTLGGAVVLSGLHGCLERVLEVTGADVLFTVVGPLDRADTRAAGGGEGA